MLTSRIACPPFGGIRNGLSRTGVEGIADLQYAIPHMLVDYHAIEAGIPVSYWRSVGYSQNTFFAESFLDEMAAAGKKDPVEMRRRLLGKSPRLLGVLDLVAAKAEWGKPLPSGHGRGVSLVNNIGSYTAQVAEVSVTAGKLRVHRVICAVDCGRVVNPAILEQQIQSGIAFGLAAALKGGITIDRGRVQQSNFHQYDVLRIDEMPVVEVHSYPAKWPRAESGEASTPGIAPAVAMPFSPLPAARPPTPHPPRGPGVAGLSARASPGSRDIRGAHPHGLLHQLRCGALVKGLEERHLGDRVPFGRRELPPVSLLPPCNRLVAHQNTHRVRGLPVGAEREDKLAAALSTV